MKTIDRRGFFKWAGLAAAGGALAAAGGGWWLANREQDMPRHDPFVPEPWQAAGGPAPVGLVVNEDPAHPFGRHLAEILWVEGLNAFSAARMGDISAGWLGQFACVLVSAGACSSAASQLLADYTAAGGRLVVFQPEGELARALGLGEGGSQQACATQEGAAAQPGLYGALLAGGHPLAAGIDPRPLTLHVPALAYPAEGAEVLASLAESGTPGVWLRRLGAGWVAGWAYDLPGNIVLTRQGNPANAAGADGAPLQRPVDLFRGWLDFERMQYPQADEQQRLLANLVDWLCRPRLPLPRLWYFSGRARALLVATSDSHRNTFPALEGITRLVEARGGAMTINYTPPLPGDPGLLKIQLENLAAGLGIGPQLYFPTPEQIGALRARGHEVSMHPYITDSYSASFERYWQAFLRMRYGPVTETVRIHDLDWRGWSDAAQLLASFGIHLNTDYYHFGPLFHTGPGQWAFGHFTGSGLPMRFANPAGRVLNIYQQVTQFGDEHFFEVPWTGPEHMGPVRGAQTIASLLQASLDGQYAAVAINFHADAYDMEERYHQPAAQLLGGALDEARARGISIWTAQRWLNFIRARQAARFSGLAWDGAALSFELTAPPSGADGLALLLPQAGPAGGLRRVLVDGLPTAVTPWPLGAVNYALLELAPGGHQLRAEYG